VSIVTTSIPLLAAPASVVQSRLRTQARSLTVRLLVAALCFRLLAAAVGFIANVTIPDYQNQGFTVFAEPSPFWDRFARYDSGWYNNIASHGYRYVEGGRSNLAFFPLYPQLMGVGGRLLGGAQEHFYFAGIAISWVSFMLAMVLLYRLASLDLPHDAAVRAATYAAVFPSAYFFGAVYSEALFLFTLVGAVLAIRTRHWGWAVVAGAAMTATRVNGVMFVPALALLAWQSAGPDRRARAAGLAAALGSTIGIGAYCLFNYQLSGDPFAWFFSIQRWGYYPGGNPLRGLATIVQALLTQPIHFLTTQPMAPYDTLNASMAIFALAAVPFVWKRFGSGYAAIILLGLLLPLSSGQYEGLGRYCSVLFPLSLWLGSMKGELKHQLTLTACVLVYALGSTLFANVHPLF
jgi:hypothetical protein